MDSSESANSTESLGARLRSARERAGLTLAVAADKLHCDAGIITALEADRFDEFGAAVYVRGHVRRYAELVGESAQQMQELFASATANSAQLPDLTRAPKAERAPDPRSLVAPLVATAIALFVAAAIWWVIKGHRLLAAAAPAATTAAVTAPAVAAATRNDTAPQGNAATPNNAPSAAAGGAMAAVATGTGATKDAAAVVKSPENSAAALPSPGAGNGAAVTRTPPPPAPMQLRLTSTADCWIEAYDEHGKRIYFGMASPNSVQQINGPAPLRILLGNVRAVTMEVNGHVTAVRESLRRGGSAWFAVAADGQLQPAAELGNAPVNGAPAPIHHAASNARTVRRRPAQH